MKTPTLVALFTFAALALGAVLASTRTHAEPQPPFDRALVERLIRAEETQAEALRQLNSTLRECGRR